MQTSQCRTVLTLCLRLSNQMSTVYPSLPFPSHHTTPNGSLAFMVALVACHQPMLQRILTNCNSVYFLSTKWVKGTVEFMKVAEIENNLFPWLHIFLPLPFWRILHQLNSLFSSKQSNNFFNYSLSCIYLLIRTYIAI